MALQKEDFNKLFSSLARELHSREPGGLTVREVLAQHGIKPTPPPEIEPGISRLLDTPLAGAKDKGWCAGCTGCAVCTICAEANALSASVGVIGVVSVF